MTSATESTETSVLRFDAAELRAFVSAVLQKDGTPTDTASLVADTLVDADERGVHTHGVVRLPSYRAQIRVGEVLPAQRPAVEREHGPTAWVDGRCGFGALTGVLGADEALARAHVHGVGVVAARQCMHFGAAAYYATRIARAGMIGIAATNTPGVLAPSGGLEARLGNNPISIAAPLPDGREPFVLDMAQSAVARGRVKLAEMNGEQIPEGWAIDPSGHPTTDPTAALAGALLPFGGYKGYGLALAVEILTGVLAGGGLSPELVNTSMTGAPAARREVARTEKGVGNLYLAVDPDRFVGRDRFLERIAWFLDTIKATPPAPGSHEVLVPGELEARESATARSLGVMPDPSAVPALRTIAVELGVPFPDARAERL